MIYTITTNPSLDYYLKIDELNVGVLNRSKGETFDAAGKGVNVSKFLNNLGINSTALGFLGGYNKDYYLDILAGYEHIQPLFTPIKGSTRINVKIDAGEETSLNAKGPDISDEEFERFLKRFDYIFENDYVVLSGNVQEDLKEKVIETMIKLMESGHKVILDTDYDIIERLAPYKPFLIKMTYFVIGKDLDEVVKVGKRYIDQGAKYFMYSAHYMPSIMCTEDCYYKCDISDKNPQSLIGTNDSMIAGFLWASLKAASAEEAFLSANAVTISTNLLERSADMDLIHRNYRELKAERFEYK